jgi:hypothetical protein
MTDSTRARALIAILGATLALTACGGGSNAPLPSAMTQSAPMAKASGPAPCPGQSTTSLYASTPAAALQSKVGALCIPAFGGFGGTMEYPPAKPSITATLTASTTNYNQQLPTLGKKGKPIYYLEVQTSGNTVFGFSLRANGGLTSAKLVAGKPYTLYGEGISGGIVHFITNFTPCVATAKSGKDGGVIPAFGRLLVRQKLANGALTIYFEVYKGKLTAQPC